MSPLIHFIVSAIIAAILYPLVGMNAIIVILAGVFIDIDHPPVYFIMFKSLDIKKAYNYFKTHSLEISDKLCAVLHTIEILFFLAILSLFFAPALFVLIGFAAHMAMDIAEIYIKYRKIRVFSLIWWLATYKSGKT